MLLYDSSIWIEWSKGTALGQTFNAAFQAIHETLVPTLVQFELQKWATREAGPQKAKDLLTITTTAIVVPLDSSIAIRAADLSATFKLHSTDAIIYATALQLNATLITCDSHFEGLPDVQYVLKQ
jgi:predicted nucleic acid-binding protein